MEIDSGFLEKYRALLAENSALREENEILKARLVAGLIPRLSPGNELGALRNDDEEAEKPWETVRMRWSGSDFPQEVRLVKANMLYMEKAGISQRGLNTLKRLAAFRNPEFYKAQALRLPTYDKPRIISCSEETETFLCLPGGAKRMSRPCSTKPV